MSTGENWNGIMRDLALESSLSWAYCIIFTLLIQFVFLNLFVAIVLGNFSAVLTKSKKDVISNKSLRDFAAVWQNQVDRFEGQVRMRLMASLNTVEDEEEERSTSKNLAKISEEEIDERCYRLALVLMDSTYLPAAAFPDFFVGLKPPLGLPAAKSLSPSDLMRFIRIASVPVAKTGMINARATLSALIDYALGAESDDESYQLMQSALRIRMKSDSKSIAAHSKAIAEKASTHTVAEEISARRLQLTTRYILSRRRISRMVEEGIYTAAEGADIIEQLSLQHNRDVVASTINVDLFSSHKKG